MCAIMHVVPNSWIRRGVKAMAVVGDHARPPERGIVVLLYHRVGGGSGLQVADVKRVILESATRMPDRMVARPGASGDVVKFGDLSATGGIVNAYAALKLAEQLSAARP